MQPPPRLLRAFALATFLLPTAATAASTAPVPEPEFTVVFKKDEKYALIRTPQILVTKAGTLLAVAQGRLSDHDQSENDIIAKRSTDGGKTWSPYVIVADAGRDTLNSINVVQVRETGRVIVMGSIIPFGYEYANPKYLSPGMQGYQKRNGRYDRPFISLGYEGNDIQRAYVVTSDDDGRTWSPMTDVTREAKMPPPMVWVMPGPGIGLQLQYGPHAGRIVMPCYARWLNPNSTTAVPGEERGSARYEHAPYMVYSDDRGKSWKRGELAKPGKPPAGKKSPGTYTSEPQIVELDDGTLMLNARAGTTRNVSRSRDGGVTWDPVLVDDSLKVTETAGGIIAYSRARDGEKGRLLFSNPVAARRTEGRIWISYDEGRTWPHYRVLVPGAFSYSTLARMPDGRVGCLYDGEGKQVWLARFPIAWLEARNDAAPVAP
jgi:sialidase-1